MTSLITNNNAFPGTSINTNDNLTNIAIGNKVLIDAGIVNTRILGSWNRLVAGASTVIQLGVKTNFTIANSTKIIYGTSWQYSGPYQVICDNDRKYALKKFKLAGGTTPEILKQHKNRKESANTAFYQIIATFLFTIGLSLLDIKFPGFTTTANENNFTNDPSTGEIIDISNPDISFTKNIIPITIINSALVFFITIAQLLLAHTLTNDTDDFISISNLELDNANIKAIVFSDITTIPQNDKQKSPYAKLHMQNDSQILIGSIGNNFSNPLYGAIHLAKSKLQITTRHAHNSANILLGELQNQPNSILIESTNKELQGGAIMIDDDDLIIYRNSGNNIEISSLYPLLNSSDDSHSDSDDSSTTSAEHSSRSSIGSNMSMHIIDLISPEYLNAGLIVSPSKASLFTNEGTNAIMIDNHEIILRQGKSDIAKFNPDEIIIGNKKFTNTQTCIGDVLSASSNDSSIFNKSNSDNLSQINTSIVKKIKDLIQINKATIKNEIVRKL